MSIRAAIDGDAAAIALVHITSWRSAYRGIIPDELLEGLDEAQRTAQWVANIAGNSIRTIVADSDGRIVGFASFGSTRDDDECDDDDPTRVGEIQAIYVNPNEWSKGIGQSLCACAIEELSAQSYEQITLWVLKDNRRACRFYELAGFDLDGTTKVKKIGVPLELARYRMQLQYGR
ncbi:MAG: GNAT family N-acetyltransferase [Planctomycetes bacterium]|nr:GNAT family N-acetyltransferase [Planctomycetota bacterium]